MFLPVMLDTKQLYYDVPVVVKYFIRGRCFDQTLLSQDIALNQQINFAIKINLYKYDVNIIFKCQIMLLRSCLIIYLFNLKKFYFSIFVI